MLKTAVRTTAPVTNRTLALILAGGQGKRLAPLSYKLAKPALTIGGQYHLIDFSLSNCLHSDITTVGILTQHQPRDLHKHVKEVWQSNRLGPQVDLLPAQSQPNLPGRYTGTADAILQNKDYIAQENPDYVLVLSGNHIYSMDYRNLIKRHSQSGAGVTIAAVETPVEKVKSASVLTIDSNCNVSAIRHSASDSTEKQDTPQTLPGSKSMCLVSTGVYVFSREVLLKQLHIDNTNELSAHDLERNIIPALIKQAQVAAFPETSQQQGSYWQDVNCLDSYWQSQMDFINSSETNHLQCIERPIQPHSLPIKPQTLMQQSARCHGWVANSILHQAGELMGSRINQSVLSEGVCVGERSFIHKSLLMAGCSIGENCHIQRAIIESGCCIADDTIIGFDLEKDAADFHITQNGIVVITSEMLESRQLRNSRMAA